MPPVQLCMFAGMLLAALGCVQARYNTTRSFTISNDLFMKDGSAFQIISGRCGAVDTDKWLVEFGHLSTEGPEKGDVLCAAYTTSVSTLPSGKPGPLSVFWHLSFSSMQIKGLKTAANNTAELICITCAGKTAFIS